MNKKGIHLGIYIIASAIIWGAVIVGCSLSLRGTECYHQIQNVLFGGFITHLILVWGPMAAIIQKTKNKTGTGS